jgi:hypothetical protein
MAEQKPSPLADVRLAPPPPKPAARKLEREMPKLGDKLWYRLSSNMELVPAEVIESMPSGNPAIPAIMLNAPHHGHLHLKITLDPERHFSSGPIGYRQDAPEAVDGERVANTWQREKSDDEDDIFEREQYRAELEQQIRQKIARGDKV